MFLSREEERVLDGEEGEIRARAMKLLVAIGDVYDAPRMIRVRSAQISGVSYKTIGEPGLEFLQEISSGGATATVKAMLNPAGMDLAQWRELGVPENFARKQLKIMQCFDKMKVEPTCTCIPYYAGKAPTKGEHVAWAESSAVVFANSILGAYTNREGGPTALASAILGLTPLYGMHIDEQRIPTHRVKLKCELGDDLDYSLLGYWIGDTLGSNLPRIDGFRRTPSLDELKALGASMAASGSIPMFSIERSCDEHREYETVSVDKTELLRTRRRLSSGEESRDICLGCPHLSLEELKLVASLVSGRKMVTRMWCFTSRHIYNIAKHSGYVDVIQRAGGKVMCDTCMVVSPIREMGIDSLLTNSCKAAHYLKSSRIGVRLTNLKRCVRYALR